MGPCVSKNKPTTTKDTNTNKNVTTVDPIHQVSSPIV